MGSPNSHNEYKPRRGEVVACYDEHIKLWHRAKVESIKAERADVLYIDFGNVSLSLFLIYKKLRIIRK
jgi:hypothetical protein